MASIDGISLIGRPSKYDFKYCEELIEHMKLGYSYESFAGRIGVAIQTIYTWEKEHEEFLEAKQIGRSAMLFKDEDSLNQGIDEIKKVNARLLEFKMKHCHGWNKEDTSNGLQEIAIVINERDLNL